MSIRGADRWVMDPTDVRGAGYDEWASMTGMAASSPLLGGPGWGGYAGTAAAGDLGSFTTVVTGNEGTPAMPGGAPANRKARAQWSGWQELFDVHSPMLWLLLFAIFATSLVHFRLQGSVGRAHASAGVG
jgi:hypothetical protein